MYKRASKFLQHCSLTKVTGKSTRKRKRRKSRRNIDWFKNNLSILFPQYRFRRFCKYSFNGIKVLLYKARTLSGYSDIVVIVNPGELSILRKGFQGLVWSPNKTDKYSIAKFIIEKGFFYKAIENFLQLEMTRPPVQ